MEMRISRRRFTLGSAVTLAGLRGINLAAQELEDNVYTFAFLGLDRDEGGGAQRSDVMMLSRVDLNDYTVRTLSIPRDLYVEVPGYGYAKINHGFQWGLELDPEHNWESGAESAVATITHNFGVEIDGVVALEFPRMAEAIDAIGGIEIDNPYEVTDGGHHYPAGLIKLEGEEAVFFVRTRNQDGDGGRVMRQHLMLAAMLEKLQQPEMLPLIPDLIETLGDVIHTDIDDELKLKLVAALPFVTQENLEFTNIEKFLWSGYTSGGAWIYQGDWSVLPQYVEDWLDGKIEDEEETRG